MEYQSFKIFDPEAEKIIEGLRIADCMNLLNIEEEYDLKEESATTYNLKELAVSDVLTCSYCNITFTDAPHQRNHYKLDWHRYNLKRALTGNKFVSEEVFNSLAALDDVSSISGSDSEKSEDSDTDASEPSKPGTPSSVRSRYKSNRHSKAFFINNENKILSVYKCLLHSKKENPTKDELVKNAYDLIKKPKKWMIVLLGGGHFASAIFSDGEVLNHKTFHCYTVRAKQGGSQSTRDNKGGHPKSAGASLRRYNEQALIQHVQEIMSSWSEPLKQCSLILYRATGPYNRGVLFGGKIPVLSKTDPRLRNIPFPTRRATFKEVNRVYDMLSCIEIYGSADQFKDKFPPNPDKRTWSPKSKKEPSGNADCNRNKNELQKEEKASPRKSQGRARDSHQAEFTQQDSPNGVSSESEENENALELLSSEVTVSFQALKECEDTVPQHIKDLKNSRLKQKKKRIKSSSKQKLKVERKNCPEEFYRIQANLIKSCQQEDKTLLMENISIYADLPEGESTDSPETGTSAVVFTKKHFIECLNAPVDEETKNTLLHLAAAKGLPDFITALLTVGADPAIKNRNKLTPYVIGDKETRNAFRLFASSFPDKYDFKKANIPEPVNEEKAKELEDKKKEKKKLKRIKEKVKRREDRDKRFEEEEKKKFLALSDREKCALAAERRLLTSSTANMASVRPPVLSRCFQCGVDITGVVAFEYGNNRFCSIPCLKAHRLKTNSYGKEI